MYTNFPVWLRFAHFINLIFITLLIRSGIEILSSFPKLYWNDHALPGTEWIKFTKRKMPKDKLWIGLEEEESFSSWIALPGHKNLGMGRHWHFFSIIFWIANGAAYYILLFSSDEWQRLIPTSFSIIPQAIHIAMIYATFHIPPESLAHPYNALQQLTYFAVVFLLGPFMIATGAAMSPAIDARFPWYSKTLFRGKQVARSLNFLGMIAFVLFIIVHVAMVLIERFPETMGHIVLGYGTNIVVAIGLFALYVVVVVIIHTWATAISLRGPRLIQHALGAVVERARRLLFHKLESRQQYQKSEISPFFRVNGWPPDTTEYEALLKNNFKNWRLKITGLVERPLELSLGELHSMHKQVQITEHHCIQGWTAVAEWGGVPLKDILTLCKPLPAAHHLVFHSYQYTNNMEFYEVIDMELANHPQTILAYEMNEQPLLMQYGAPLRLRLETQLGFKMVKWIRSIEFVSDYKNIEMGQGGHREDHMYYDMTAEI